MKYVASFLNIILFCAPALINAQTDVTIRKKDFRNDKTGFEAAWKHVIDGDKYFNDKEPDYGNAFEEYLKAAQYNGSCPGLNYKTGVSALLSDNKEKAATFLQNAMEQKPDLAADMLFYTGRALQFAGNYNEAIDKLSSWLSSPGKKPESKVNAANRYIEQCKAAIEITKDTLRVSIENAGSVINSSADDYSEILSSDGSTIFFASRRELDRSTKIQDAKFDENILFSASVNGEWGIPVTAGKKVTTKYCETPVYLSPGDEELYIYTGYENGGDIKVSVKKRGEWGMPQNIPYKINTGGMETSMTISPSGNEVWFVTDRGKKSLGGKDIYFIRKTDKDKWSKPVNAGPSINSPLNEESVRFSHGGDTLWFSSTGHNSMGGYDIFMSVRDKDGNWGNAVNCGFPVNSAWDDLFYFPMQDNDSIFYLSSNRAESIGGLDIFKGRFLPAEPVIVQPAPPKPDTVVIRDTVVLIKEVVKQEPVILQATEPPKDAGLYLTGKIKDSETGDPVLAKIDIIDFRNDAVIATTASSDVDGSYRVKLPAKTTYMVDLHSTGYLSEMKKIIITDSFAEEAFTLDVPLIKIKVGKKVVLNNIFFETGKSVLSKASYEELDKLANMLKDDEKIRIEVSGHTDRTGSEPINFRLSEARAKAVADYLVSKGIQATRLEFRGFGSLQPVSDNATPEGRAKNRRVEFKILEF